MRIHIQYAIKARRKAAENRRLVLSQINGSRYLVKGAPANGSALYMRDLAIKTGNYDRL